MLILHKCPGPNSVSNFRSAKSIMADCSCSGLYNQHCGQMLFGFMGYLMDYYTEGPGYKPGE